MPGSKRSSTRTGEGGLTTSSFRSEPRRSAATTTDTPTSTETAESKSERMKRYADLIVWHVRKKAHMIRLDLTQAKATCPKCHTKDAVRLSRARVNDHVHWGCTVCKTGMME